MDLYHSDIRLPDGFRLPRSTARLRWTQHAQRAAKTDRYGTIPRFNEILLTGCEAIEVGTKDGKVVHLLLRMSYEGDRDVVMAIRPISGEPWIVKTVWFNLKTDTHRTLDKSKYIN